MKELIHAVFAASLMAVAAGTAGAQQQQSRTPLEKRAVGPGESVESAVRGEAAYPAITIHNYAPFGFIAHASFEACDSQTIDVSPATYDKAGNVTPGKAEENVKGGTACMVHNIVVQPNPAAKVGVITDYRSTGTTYREYYFLPTTEQEVIGAGIDWQLFSAHEANIPDQGTTGKSPGFVITNKTKWPVAVSLSQVGCLYHDALRPGQSMNRTTGAVWFTVTAQIVPDGVDPNTDLACAIPVVEVVADVLEAALTAGAVSWAGLTAAAVEESVGPAAAYLIPTSAISSATTAGAKGILMSQYPALIANLFRNRTDQLMSQYAGPPWPIRCDQKPTYEITGGWGATGYRADGFWIDPGSPLTITKTNSCGDVPLPTDWTGSLLP